MKKVCMFLVVLALAIHMESYAQDATPKYRYVMWDNDNPPKTASLKEMVTWIKSAAKGQKIPGASVRSKPQSYKEVWGETLYNAVMNGAESDFTSGYADGSEKNYGVNADGDPEQTGILNKGTIVFKFKGIPIVKWGTNGCLNAVAVTKKTDLGPGDPEDKDNQKTVLITPSSSTTTNNLIASSGGSGHGGSDMNGLLVYQTGEMNGVSLFKDGFQLGASTVNSSRDHQALTDIALLKSVPAPSTTCCSGGGGTIVSSAVQPAGNIYIREVATSGTTASTAGSQQIVVKTDHTFGETLTGGIISNAVGGFIANVGTQLLFGNRRSTGYYGQGFQSGPIIRSGGPSQGGNPIAGGTSYTSTGGGLGPGSNGW